MENELKSGIYCIENITTNKKYIGQSIDIKDRWRRHIGELEHNSHYNDYLQKAWNKHGKDNFNFYILEYCDIDKLDEKEVYYIDFYKTLDRDYGYNLKTGGQLSGNSYSDEVRQKMSESVKKSYENSNLKELRKINAINQWANPEIKEKIMGSNNGMYGKRHTEETKRKISEIRKRPSTIRKIRSVVCIELNQTFKNAGIASKTLNIPNANILNVCYGKRQTAGGYHWKFLENNIEE